jgi:hypothetical protein
MLVVSTEIPGGVGLTVPLKATDCGVALVADMVAVPD